MDLGGVKWNAAPVPPVDHECWVQSSGWVGMSQYERCACGAVRRNGRAWLDKNTRTQ